MSNAMPKFDFSKATIKTEAELAALSGGKKEDTSKLFKPGRHEVTIQDVTIQPAKPDAKDPSWITLAVTYKGTGLKTIKDFVQVPTRDIVYGEKKTLYPFQRLQGLVNGLGGKLNAENVGEVLPSLLGKPENLVGKNVAIEVGYQRAHVKYVRQGEETVVQINMPGNKGALTGENGEALIFPDRDAAEAHMDAAGIAYDSFPRILGYAVSATPNKSATDSNW